MMKCDFAKGDTWRKSEDSISPAYSPMYNDIICICVSVQMQLIRLKIS